MKADRLTHVRSSGVYTPRLRTYVRAATLHTLYESCVIYAYTLVHTHTRLCARTRVSNGDALYACKYAFACARRRKPAVRIDRSSPRFDIFPLVAMLESDRMSRDAPDAPVIGRKFLIDRVKSVNFMRN